MDRTCRSPGRELGFVVTVLKAEQISLSLGMTDALADVSLEVAAGETVAVMGPSGSGKSTLLHCLAGLRVPDQGVVCFRGLEISRQSEQARSRQRLAHMGVVFQFAELVPELTTIENVALPAWMSGCNRRTALASAEDLLDGFGIAGLAGKYPGEVSGGERQRAAVARALVHDPTVVLADEPTGALDSANGQLVLEALMRQASTRGAAVVLVTHEARLAAYCEREVTIRDGRLAEALRS